MLLEAIIVAQLTWPSPPVQTITPPAMQGAPAGATIGEVPMPKCPEGWTLVMLLPANDVMYARCAREIRIPEQE